MGFLDKLQQTAKDTLEKGKEKVEEVQADRKADQLLRDLGAWYYAGRTGRDDGAADEHVERIVGELQAHEAEFGPLGQASTAAETPAPAPAPTDAAAPPAAASPSTPSTPPPPDPPPMPADPTAPVTSGPPPPPPS